MTDHIEPLTSKGRLQNLMEEGAERTAVVGLWGAMCERSEELKPRYASLAEEMADEPVEFFEVEAREHPEVVERFHVHSIPTIAFLHDGDIVETTVGAPDLDDLRERTRRLLERAENDGWFDWLLG